MSTKFLKHLPNPPFSLKKTGLTQRDWQTLCNIFDQNENVKEVRLFGSRAKGNFKSGSDIDLAIMNPGVDLITEIRIKGECEESSLPYFVDIANYPTLKNSEFKAHIERVSIPFYLKTESTLVDTQKQ